MNNKLRKAITLFLAVLLIVSFFAMAASAATKKTKQNGALIKNTDFQSAPVATHMEYAPELVSFRVWVEPGISGGVQVAGHYEYFDMMMDLGNAKEVIDTPELSPALQASPSTLATEPAMK